MKHKSLLLHHDLKAMFDMLSYEEVGKLIIAAFEYDIDGTEIQFGDKVLDLCYIRIKNMLDRNSSKYEEVCRKRADAARKRWEQSKLYKEEGEVSQMH